MSLVFTLTLRKFFNNKYYLYYAMDSKFSTTHDVSIGASNEQ